MKKRMALVLAAIMLLTMGVCAPIVQADGGAADAEVVTNLVGNGGLEDASNSSESSIRFYAGTPEIITTGGAYEGDNYLALNNAGDQIRMTLGVEEKTNYIFSFWAKTSVNRSLLMHLEGYAKYGTVWQNWAQWCDANGISRIAPGEIYFNVRTGTSVAEGETAEWTYNQIEFRTPHYCTHVQIDLSGFTDIEDAERAVDDIRVVKTDDNLILNGDFSGRITADKSAYTPNSAAAPTKWDLMRQTGTPQLEYIVEENGNAYVETTGGDVNYSGGGIYQNVYLYPGTYELSYKMKTSDDKLNFVTLEDTGGTNPLTSNTIMDGSVTSSVESPDGWRHFKTYFTLTDKLMGQLRFGRPAWRLTNAYDDVKLCLVNDGAVHLGKQVKKMDNLEGVNDGSSADFSFIDVNTLTAGETISAYGMVPVKETVTNGMAVTGLYKTSDKGTTLVDFSISNITSGKPFLGEGMLVPELEAGEQLFVKTTFWDDKLNPISEVFQ